MFALREIRPRREDRHPCFPSVPASLSSSFLPPPHLIITIFYSPFHHPPLSFSLSPSTSPNWIFWGGIFAEVFVFAPSFHAKLKEILSRVVRLSPSPRFVNPREHTPVPFSLFHTGASVESSIMFGRSTRRRTICGSR